MIYEYQCENCNSIIEYYTTNYDIVSIECDRCPSGIAHRIMSTYSFRGKFYTA